MEKETRYLGIPLAIAGSFIPRGLVEPLLRLEYRLLGVTPEKAEFIVRHELDHVSGNPGKFHLVGCIRNQDTEEIELGCCVILSPCSTIEKAKALLAVGRENMSARDLKLLFDCINDATHEERQQIQTLRDQARQVQDH